MAVGNPPLAEPPLSQGGWTRQSPEVPSQPQLFCDSVTLQPGDLFITCGL